MISLTIRSMSSGRGRLPFGVPAWTRRMSHAGLSPNDAQPFARAHRALCDLRQTQRHAVAILDTHCGCGALLIAIAEDARRLGFTAVEACGCDASSLKLRQASAEARQHADPAVGFRFDRREPGQGLDADDAAFDLTLTDEIDSTEVGRVASGGVVISR